MGRGSVARLDRRVTNINALTELLSQWMEVVAEHRSFSLTGVFQVDVQAGNGDSGDSGETLIKHFARHFARIQQPGV